MRAWLRRNQPPVPRLPLFTVALAQPVLVHASTWKKLSTTTSPPARSYPAMAYDQVSQKIVFAGMAGLTDHDRATSCF
jgi:hypothetical protein